MESVPRDEYPFVQNVFMLMSVVDEMKLTLETVSRNLNEMIPNMCLHGVREEEYIRDLLSSASVNKEDTSKSEENESRKTNSISSAAVVRTKKIHRKLYNRPPTPIAKLSNIVVSSAKISDETTKSRGIPHTCVNRSSVAESNQSSKNEPKFKTNEPEKKVKEWIFPPLAMKREPKQQSGNQGIDRYKPSCPKPKTPCSSTVNEEEKISSPSSADSTTFSETQGSNLRSSYNGNDWKCRYALNGNQVEPTLQTMINIKDSVMNPSLAVAESVYLERTPCSTSSSVFVEDVIDGSNSDPPCANSAHENQTPSNHQPADLTVICSTSVPLVDHIPSTLQIKDAFIGHWTNTNEKSTVESKELSKNNVQIQTVPFDESSLSLPSIEEEQISLFDKKYDAKPFGARESSWYTVSETNDQSRIPKKAAQNQSVKAQKEIGRGRLGLLGSSVKSRHTVGNCRKHRMYCISCGRQFKSKQIFSTKEKRRNMIKIGLVQQLVDRWEILCTKGSK